MELFEVLKVLVLGIVEGFTEWLPISSTGHMILVEEIIPLHLNEDFKNVFMVVVQLGAILAVVVLYFHKLNPFSPRKKRSQKQETLSLWAKIIIACLPAAIVGLPFDDILERLSDEFLRSCVHADFIRRPVYCIEKPQCPHHLSDTENQLDYLSDCAVYQDCSSCCP